MREVKPTQKPVPSSDIKDLFFNSGLLDIWATSLEHKYIDRFGNCHLTAAGMEWIFNELVTKFKIESEQALLAAGYAPAGTFQEGAEVVSRNGTVLWKLPDGDGDHYRWDGDLPKQVPAGSTPQSTGGIGKGAWVSVGDASFRSDVKSGNGSLIGLGDGMYLDSFFRSYKNIITFEMFGVDTDSVEDYTDKIEACIQYAMQNQRVIFCTGKVFKTSRTITLDAGGNDGRNSRLVMAGEFTIKPEGNFTGVILKRYLNIDSIKVLADNLHDAFAIHSDDMYRSNIGSMTIDTEDGSISTGSGWKGNNIFLNNFGLVYIARVDVPIDIRKEFNANTVANIEIHSCASSAFLGNMKGSTINVLTIEDAKNGGVITGGNIGSVINALYVELNKGTDFKVDHSFGFDGGITSGLLINQVMNFNNSNNTKTLPVIDIVDGGARFGDVTFGGTNVSGYVGVRVSSTGKGSLKSISGSGFIENNSSKFILESLQPYVKQVYPYPELGRSNPTPLRSPNQTILTHTVNTSAKYVECRAFGDATGGSAANTSMLIAEVDVNGNSGVTILKESPDTSIGVTLSYNKVTREITLKCKSTATTAQTFYLFINEVM